MVTTGRLHENFCVLTQVNNGMGHLLQSNVCVRKFAGSESHFPLLAAGRPPCFCPWIR